MSDCKDILKIVRGNGFELCLQVEAKHPDGTPVEGFSLNGDEVLTLLHSGTGETKTYERVDNSIFVTFDGTDALGWYGLEMTGVYADEPWRWCVTKVFQIVETNERAHIPSWTILADDTYIIGCGITLLTSVCQADWDEVSTTAPSYIKNKPDLNEYALATDLLATNQRVSTLEDTAVKMVVQRLTNIQKTTARANISAYTKPTGGIPSTDLSSAVQTSLGKADNAQPKLTAGTGITIDDNNVISATDDKFYLVDLSVNDLLAEPLASTTIAKLSAMRIDPESPGKLILFHAANDSGNTLVPATILQYGSQFDMYLYFDGRNIHVTADSSNTTWEVTQTTLYVKPSGGIPYNDLSAGVKHSLDYADAAVQSVTVDYQDEGVPVVVINVDGDETEIITSQQPSGPEYHTAPSWVAAEEVFEQKYLKVTSVSASSTDSQYPSAKCVYDLVGDVASLLAAI